MSIRDVISDPWAHGYAKGESDGRQHARAAWARLLRARADEIKKEIDSRRMDKVDYIKAQTRVAMAEEIADALEAGAWEGPELEMNA